MPTSLTLEEHLAAIEASGSRLADLADDAGMNAPVPTCPAWTVRHVVAHQAMVHRWAAANVRGDDPDAVPNQTEIGKLGNLIGYYRGGLAALVNALCAAAPDLEAMTFLNDAPAPREFWARRQAHETTIHMVDTLAAAVGRFPKASEVAIDPNLAVDGIDELLRGFFTRGRSKLFDGEEYTIAVEPTDSDRRWVVHVAERMTVEPGDPAPDGDATATLRGTAAQLYLGLWNRGDEIEATGRADVIDRWRTNQRVSWS